MPYIHVSTDAALDQKQKSDLKAMLGQTIELLPGKSEAVLMLRIDEQTQMYFKGEKGNCAILAVHLYKESPHEAKKVYAKQVLKQFCELTKLPAERVFMNFTEHNDWAGNGALIER